MSQAIENQEQVNQNLRMIPEFNGDFFSSICQYPIIVEGWDKKNDGRAKRAYLEAFDAKERKALARLYPTLYRWYLVTGTPRKIRMKLGTVSLLQRAVCYFGTL